MNKSLLAILAIAVIIVGSVYLINQRTSTSQGLRVVDVDELSTLKDQPGGPILIQYSSDQWKEITKDIPTIDGFLPRTGGQLGYIPDFEPDFPFPPKRFFVQPRCPSPGPGYVCTPNFTFGAKDELIFAGCTCFPPPKEGSEEEKPEPETASFECPLVFGGAKLFSCQGNCTEEDGCTASSCVTVRSAEFPDMIECDCVRIKRLPQPDRPIP